MGIVSNLRAISLQIFEQQTILIRFTVSVFVDRVMDYHLLEMKNCHKNTKVSSSFQINFYTKYNEPSIP